ncbi:unnamed protein product, partial [Timema podura]|nr:unnamed protein product [Timema podura]
MRIALVRRVPPSRRSRVSRSGKKATLLISSKLTVSCSWRARKICNNCLYLYPRDMSKKGILERLAEGVVIGDGGFVFALEKRGYVKAGPWTPEATCENPEA